MARSDSDDERDRKKARKEKKEHKEKKRDKERDGDKERKKDKDRDREKDKKREDRKSEKERERDDEKASASQPEKAPPPPPPPSSKPKTTDTGGEISMSIDETNKMRVSMGTHSLCGLPSASRRAGLPVTDRAGLTEAETAPGLPLLPVGRVVSRMIHARRS